MKCHILALALSLASFAAAAPAQSRLNSVNELQPWYEPGGCSGSYREECMGTAMFCKMQDEAACLKKRRPAPGRHQQHPGADVQLAVKTKSSARHNETSPLYKLGFGTGEKHTSPDSTQTPHALDGLPNPVRAEL